MFRALSLSFLSVVVTSAMAGTPSASTSPASPADPHLVLGKQSCVKCHASEVKVWENTPHARTFNELHRRPEAKQIAAKLGLKSIKHDGRCIACHYTTQHEASAGKIHAISGVSCESCHGAAKHWLDLHHNYGGEGITRATESKTHRAHRIATSIAAGMRNPANVFLVAQSCLRCHTAPDEQLVNQGGHSAGSLDFEFVSWSQGTVRHNFVRTDGKRNDASPQTRLRVMFVAGMVAELEASLRATAGATQKATFGVTAAKRASRAGKRLASVAQKIEAPELSEVLTIFKSVKLKLNNREELTAAADEVARLGYELAERHDGKAWAALDAFIPPAKTWK